MADERLRKKVEPKHGGAGGEPAPSPEPEAVKEKTKEKKSGGKK